MPASLQPAPGEGPVVEGVGRAAAIAAVLCSFVFFALLGTFIFIYHTSHLIQSNPLSAVEHPLGARYGAKHQRRQDGPGDPYWQQRSQLKEKNKYLYNGVIRARLCGSEQQCFESTEEE